MDALRILAGVTGALAGVAVIVAMLWILTSRDLTQPQIAGARTDAQRDEILAKSRADDQQTLTSYGWINRDKGIVRIPIEDAMAKLAQESAK